MLPTFDVPAIWIPSGGAQRRLGTPVIVITFSANEQGCYLQCLTQNVRVTVSGDTVSTPVIGSNDLGFQLLAGAEARLFVGQPGMTLRVLQEAATAVVQYQMLTLAGRFSG